MKPTSHPLLADPSQEERIAPALSSRLVDVRYLAGEAGVTLRVAYIGIMCVIGVERAGK